MEERFAGNEAADVFLVEVEAAAADAVRAPGDVGRDDDVVELPQGVSLGERLGVGDVEAGAGEAFGIEGLDERVAVEKLAAGNRRPS